MSNETATPSVVTPKEKKTRNVQDRTYKVVSLPTDRERLPPQLKALVTVIEDAAKDGAPVSRKAALAAWIAACGSKAAESVFTSYIHALISFAFMDKIPVVAAGTEKKILSAEERKAKLLDMISKLPDADKKELLAKLGA